MPTLGQELKKLRLHKGLTTEAVASETRIPARIIADLEDDNYAGFDSVTYVRNFLTSYGKHLGVNVSEALKDVGLTHRLNSQPVLATGKRTLEGTRRPKAKTPTGLPIFLAPLLIILVGFVCLSLYFVVREDQLPFAPEKKVPVAEQTAVPEPKVEVEKVVQPVRPVPVPVVQPLVVDSGRQPIVNPITWEDSRHGSETVLLTPPPQASREPRTLFP